MRIVTGILALTAGIVVILLRNRFADRSQRQARRKYRSLGAENAKHMTPGAFLVGGIVFVAIGIYNIVSYYVTYGF